MGNVLGIVPARGGSKSIPRKNIKSFAGKPLIAWAVEILKNSEVVDRVAVSTDDQEIAEIAKKYGAEVPFLRPAEFAQDDSPVFLAIQHALRWFRENDGYWPDSVVLIEPTSPGKQPHHIHDMVKMLEETGADSVVSVAEVPGVFNPHWQMVRDGDGRLKLFTGGPVRSVIKRRQELPQTYYRGSAIYVFRPELLFKPEPSLYGEDVRGYVIDSKYSFDIDTLEDWELAERQFQKILEEEKNRRKP